MTCIICKPWKQNFTLVPLVPFILFSPWKVWTQPKNNSLTSNGRIFFNEMNIPFNVVQHLVFVEVMKTTFDLEPIKPPSYHSALCYSLFGFAIGRLGERNMGKMNCGKNESYCFFHMAMYHVPLAIFHNYETNLVFQNPNETWFAINFLMMEQLFKLGIDIEQIVTNPKWTI